MRNHSTLSREDVIKTIAQCLPERHKVDLQDPDLFVLVEIFKVNEFQTMNPDLILNHCVVTTTGDLRYERCARLLQVQEVQRRRVVPSKALCRKRRLNKDTLQGICTPRLLCCILITMHVSITRNPVCARITIQPFQR